MKLKENEYNGKVTYQIGKLDARGNGLMLGQSLTIQLTDKDFAYTALTGTRKDNGKPYRIASIVGKIVGGTIPENVKYNDFDNAKFGFSDAIDKHLATQEGNLAGKTINIEVVEKEFDVPVLDENKNVQKDENGKVIFEKKTNLVFEVGELQDDGSVKPFGNSGSSDASSSPSKPSLPKPPIPKSIQEVNEEAGFDLNDVEKAVFKEVRTNPDLKEWIAYAKESQAQFNEMFRDIAGILYLPDAQEDRKEQLYKRFKQ